jgi:hypothetical protein
MRASVTRQRHAALAHQRLVALRLAQDEVVRLGEPGRLLELGLRRVRLADAQIVGDRAVEHRAVLEHHADVAAQRLELDVAVVDAVDADDAGLRIPHAVQQRQRRALAGAGRADESHLGSGRHLQREMHQRRTSAVVGEIDIVELDVAPGAADILAVRIVWHRRLGIEDTEEIGQNRHLEKDAAHEARGLVHAADQHGGKAHEAHDLAHGRFALGVEPGAEHEDQDHGDGRGGARHDRQQRPPVQDRELRGQRLLHDAVHLAGFVRQAHEALDETDVAQRVAGAAGQLAAQVLDLLLKAIGATHHEDIGGREEQDQDDQQHPQPPIHEQAERQHDEQGDEGGEVLAEERQPDGEQIVDAGQHDLDQPAGMLGAVEGERQQQDVLEEVGHRAQPPAVGHAVGLQGDHDVGCDAAQADDGPQPKQVTGVAPQHLGRLVLGVGQEIHHLAEQHRLVELQGGHRDVGERQHDRKPALGAQQPDDPTVDAEELHFPVDRSP